MTDRNRYNRVEETEPNQDTIEQIMESTYPNRLLGTPQETMSLAVLRHRRTTLVSYLTMKVGEEDWHGVADAAMDLREIEAQMEILGGK